MKNREPKVQRYRITAATLITYCSRGIFRARRVATLPEAMDIDGREQ